MKLFVVTPVYRYTTKAAAIKFKEKTPVIKKFAKFQLLGYFFFYLIDFILLKHIFYYFFSKYSFK